MPRKTHTTDYYLLCFDVCFFHSLHSFSSSFFFLLALAFAYSTHAWNTHTRTHTQFKMNGFKLTKNSERMHSHTHILYRVSCLYMCRQATSIEWWTRWVLYALFYLIWFNSFGFFIHVMRSTYTQGSMKGWRFFDLVDICTPKNSVRFQMVSLAELKSVRLNLKFWLF